MHKAFSHAIVCTNASSQILDAHSVLSHYILCVHSVLSHCHTSMPHCHKNPLTLYLCVQSVLSHCHTTMCTKASTHIIFCVQSVLSHCHTIMCTKASTHIIIMCTKCFHIICSQSVTVYLHAYTCCYAHPLHMRIFACNHIHKYRSTLIATKRRLKTSSGTQ